MNNLTTRKIVLGLLVMLVLAFSVQGIADALTLTKTKKSGDLQTKRVDGSFEISFSVGLTRPASIKDSRGDLIDDTDAANVIDSSGYLLTEPINGKRYRESTNAGTKSGFRNAETGETGRKDAIGAHVDSSGNVVDAEGRSVYLALTGSTRVKAEPSKPASLSDRFDFNDEAIGINVVPGTMTLEMESSGYPVTIEADTTRIPAIIGIADGASLYEMDTIRGLPTTVTLICRPEEVGPHTITVRDLTPLDDFPKDTAPPQSSITFTPLCSAEHITNNCKCY